MCRGYGLTSLTPSSVSLSSCLLRSNPAGSAIILVATAASTLGDSYCSVAGGGKLADASEPTLAASVLSGSDAGLTHQETAMASWARKVVRDPNSTTPEDIERPCEAGITDEQIFSITAFVALRVAFSTINDDLGARPDHQLVASSPPAVRDAVIFGRRPSASP